MRFQKGSLKKDKHGRWVVRWREDVLDTATGETRRRYMQEILDPNSFSKRDAERYLAKKVAAVNDASYQPTARGVTFADLAKRWQELILSRRKPSGQDSARSTLNVNLLPVFGPIHLNDITAESIQVFVNHWTKGPKTLKNAMSLMMGMWDHARAWGYTTGNPFPRGTTGKLLLQLPVVEKGETYNYSLEETLAIIARAPSEKFKLLFRTLAEGGMRPGELAGMRKTDLVDRVICLSQSVYRGKIQTPKTKNSVRQFPVSQALADDLREYMESTRDQPNRYGLVWTNGAGNPIAMNKVLPEVLNPILEDLGIRQRLRAENIDAGFYAFRHMNITELRRRNVPLKTIQQRVGHAAGSKVTDKHYVHPVEEDALAAADLLGELLNPDTNGRVQ